jgi:hypothetical protein
MWFYYWTLSCIQLVVNFMNAIGRLVLLAITAEINQCSSNETCIKCGKLNYHLWWGNLQILIVFKIKSVLNDRRMLFYQTSIYFNLKTYTSPHQLLPHSSKTQASSTSLISHKNSPQTHSQPLSSFALPSSASTVPYDRKSFPSS